MVGALVVAAGLWAQPAGAVQFTWSEQGGFEFGTGALRAGGFFGPDAPPVAGHGGLEFFQLQASPPAPPNTYRSIGWGCPPDGNDDGAVNGATCANGGTAAQVVTGTDPATNPGRSALVVNTFNSAQSGVLDSQTGAEVIISRITHINNVIDDEANALRSVSITATLIVDSNPPVNDTNTIPIGFLETINISDCTQTPNPLGSLCDDEFTFDASGFDPVGFTHDGKNFLLVFDLRPIESCSELVETQGTIQIFQCTDSPQHRIAIDFTNGRAWAMEGFDNALEVTMRVLEVGVPVPAGVVLLVAGVAGWGLRAWRRRAVA
jgi:hypothetical protein